MLSVSLSLQTLLLWCCVTPLEVKQAFVPFYGLTHLSKLNILKLVCLSINCRCYTYVYAFTFTVSAPFLPVSSSLQWRPSKWYWGSLLFRTSRLCFALEVIQLAPSPGRNTKLLQQVRVTMYRIRNLLLFWIQHLLNASHSSDLLLYCCCLLVFFGLFHYRYICMRGAAKRKVTSTPIHL